MIYTTGAHNTPYLRTILGHPYTYIYIYINAWICRWQRYTITYLVLLIVYIYIYHGSILLKLIKLLEHKAHTCCWCFNRPKACFNSSQPLWDKQPTSLASWQPSWQSCSIPVPGKSTAAQTVFKPARWCCFSRNLQCQHHYRIPLSINPMCLFVTIGALSPGFWHRNWQWHSPMNGFERNLCLVVTHTHLRLCWQIYIVRDFMCCHPKCQFCHSITFHTPTPTPTQSWLPAQMPEMINTYYQFI